MTAPSAGSGWPARAVIMLSGAVAILVPVWLLWPGAGPRGRVAGAAAMIAPSPLVAESSGRRLFLDPLNPSFSAPDPDAPVLAGIAGRLPNDAVAMLRADDGATRVVAIGQSWRGWRLDSLSTDAALFVRGTRRLRVPVPITDAPAETAPGPGL